MKLTVNTLGMYSTQEETVYVILCLMMSYGLRTKQGKVTS